MSHAAAFSSASKKRVTPWLTWVIAGAFAVILLYLIFNIYAAGQPLWALGVLALSAVGFMIYLSESTVAQRYLFPGLLAIALFIALPLIYTMQIGFTNYSSNHLLSYSNATKYLLEQTTPDDATVHAYALHREGSLQRIVLTKSDSGVRLVSPPLNLATASTQPVTLTPVEAQKDFGAVLNLREVIALRDNLQQIKLNTPTGECLSYAGLREFARLTPVWEKLAEGTLKRVETGEVFKANADTGYFENEKGEPLQPGYTVGVGLANYARMVTDEGFRGPFISIFFWTLIFSAITVFFVTFIGTTLATVLNWEALRFRTLYRTLLFLPYAVPGFISILVFKGLFNQNFGEINAILNAIFGIRPAWFADPLLAKVMLVIVNVWLGFPYIMVLCAGLIKSIPADLYEASAIAGAGPLTNFFKITLPLMIKPLAPLLIGVFAYNFNNFVLIALLTDGRPDFLNTKVPAGTNDILVSYTYRIAFKDSGSDFGLAAAISTVVFVIVAILALINLRLMKTNQPTR
jgi:maltose/maltodextrin transport system permease protein